jgi:uncharacterized glyoxalase superfamily protein PhnB
MSEHPNIFPALRYRDANAALDWLQRAFGFAEKAVYRGDDGTVHHAELQLGAGMVMLGEQPEAAPSDAQTIYVVVDDPDAHHERAAAAGAQIVRPLGEMDYGSREYSVRDPEGHVWSFGTYDPFGS